MIAQLQGREKGARALRVEGRRAEWIVFACLHSGVFIRDQRSRFPDAHPEQVRCGVHALIARGMATDEMARIEEVKSRFVCKSGGSSSPSARLLGRPPVSGGVRGRGNAGRPRRVWS